MLLRVLTGFALGMAVGAGTLTVVSTLTPLPQRPLVGTLGPRSLLPQEEDLQTGLVGQAPISDAGLAVENANAPRAALPEIQPETQPGALAHPAALPRPGIGTPARILGDAPQLQSETGAVRVAQDASIPAALGQVLPEAPARSDDIEVAETPAEAQKVDEVPKADPDPAPERVALLPQAPTSARPQIGRPATSLFNREGAGSSRLPLASEAPEPVDIPAQVLAPNLAKSTPFSQYATPFEVAKGRPLVSIILMDDGRALDDETIGTEALSRFPYPITFAVDVSHPEAAARAERYRALGMEVLALIDLPLEATASDTEIAMSAALQAIPQAIGVLEGPKTGLQGSKEMSDQVTQIVKDMGLGIVWQQKGFDTAAKLAARELVPSQTIFRDFDSADQTPTVIRRFLDNAAFRAGREGEVIMMGRLRPDTISALVVWGLQDRASRVSIAPVSAVLRAGLEG